MRVKMNAATHIGRVRKSNQDSHFCDAAKGLVIVCDGIGGRKGGDIASRIAVQSMRDSFIKTDQLRPEEIQGFMASAMDKANRDVVNYAANDKQYRGMGTTANLLLFSSDRVHIAHVGDSRTYMYYSEHLWQLTVDHNVENFMGRGLIEREHIVPGTRGAALMRSLGLGDRCDVDIHDMELKSGMIFVTCSDGLSGMVSDTNLLRLIKKSPPEKLAQILVDEANRSGGRDNTTVVVTEIESSGAKR